ncbi:4Fe-4S dicluster domain-containing protein [Curtanaerobium respiraculi]|uniref:4Fe-4S dicluster domain-containing protein n=1 Tax=Curtanaerobium respiraculi TaxID=2949669 RepID=UPI0024B3A05D|nr:4Fe-4S dicluster domain-containing protein [Curtanaerobium respiraculi]
MQHGSPLSRRTLVAGAIAVGASAFIVPAVTAPSGTAFAEDGKKVQYGFMVRVDNCQNCGKCVISCRVHNRTPEGVGSRRKITAYKKKTGKEIYITTSCMHCAEPSCVTVCPSGAISKGQGGIVRVDHDRCIGCKYCYQACPFEAPHYIEGSGMDKCDCCLEAGIELGQTPFCVQSCRFGALEYGQIDELLAKTNGLGHQVEGPTGPSMVLR